MALTSKELLKEYCLRRLGHPVIEINVDEEQCDDRLNESIAQNVQLDATVTTLKDDKEKLTKELADGSSNKTKQVG